MKRLQLLLLEDSEEEALELSSFLEDNDYEVSLAKNAVEAEKLIRNRFFDVIILDIMINGRPDGISLAHRLNKEGSYLLPLLCL